MALYINFWAWRQIIISLLCFANNVIHPWPQVMPIFDQEMPPRFTPAIFLRHNFVYISTMENRGDKSEFPGMIVCFHVALNSGPGPKSLTAQEFRLVIDLVTNRKAKTYIRWHRENSPVTQPTPEPTLLLPRYGAFDLGLAVSVPLPIVTGIFVLLWFQSRLT